MHIYSDLPLPIDNLKKIPHVCISILLYLESHMKFIHEDGIPSSSFPLLRLIHFL